MQTDADGSPRRPFAAQEQRVEATVEDEQRERARGSQARAPGQEAERGERTQAVPRAEVERCGAAPALEEELRPREPAAREVGVDHRRERPRLQVATLDARVEDDPRAALREPQAELDVLDRRGRVALRVEARERGTADRTEAGPERLRGAGELQVHVVVEKVPEARDEPGVGRVAVVGAEKRVEARVGGERGAQALECVAVRLDVGVDKDEHVAGRAARALVPRGRRARSVGLVHHDDLFRRVVGDGDRGEAARERGRRVGRGDDRREPHRT